MHDTLDTTITSWRVMSELVARTRRRSMSSLIDASLAMYVLVEGTYASGW